ncbi:MAG: JAB domain-containing protein [Dehalococcoidia bacterium]|nr:JAB domain-containing protein [Dehalococcoidia bacterium]
MAPRRHSSGGQITFLAPEDAAVLQLVRENLRLLSELRPSYRSAAHGGPNSRQVRCPQDIADLLAPEMEALPQEQLRVVLLDTRNRVLDVVMVYQGSVNTAVARMAELFRDAVIANAPNVILVHNHPSGDPSPSPEDVKLTKDAAQAAQLLSIDLLDHVIIGDGRFVSLKEQGAM